MKTLRNKFWALLLITSVAFLSCKKEDRLSPYANSGNKTSTIADENTVSRNDWKITTFQIGEMSEANLFSDYIFKFKRGEIQALTSNTTDYGKWMMGEKRETVTIEFKNSPLSKLNREWNILTKTDYDIKLEQVNRMGETVSLSFQRFKRVDLTPQTDVPTEPETPTFE